MKVREMFADEEAMMNDAKFMSLLLSFAIAHKLTNMCSERLFALLRNIVGEKSPCAERISSVGM
eukprot:9485219-Pyramimonas_sp.AAC.1